MYPRVEDLKRSSQWADLESEINNLEKLCMRVKTKNCNDEPISKFDSSENYDKRSRRSKTIDTEMDNYDSKIETSETYDVCSWVPKTEFERAYFFGDREDDRPDIPSPQIGKSSSPSSGSNPISKNNYEINGTDSRFTDSRERLHEIFEHNKILRRQFFSNLPNKNNNVESNVNETHLSFKSYVNEKQNSFENVHRPNGTGFGSTETLNSPSNLSAASSANGQKSGSGSIDTPESNEYINNGSRGHDSLCARSTNARAEESSAGVAIGDNDVWSTINQSEAKKRPVHSQDNEISRDIHPLSKECNSVEKTSGVNKTVEEFLEYNPVSRIRAGNTQANFRKSMPDLSNFNFNTYLINNGQIKETNDSSIARMKSRGRVPPPLDLSKINNEIDFDRLSNGPRSVSNKSCGDLTSNRNRNSEEKIFRKRNLEQLSNRSCIDLRQAEDLLSPQLVSDFENSMVDLMRSIDSEKGTSLCFDEPRVETGTGTTLPLVYGPIPYKSPRRYVEGEVTIHYRSPVRTEAKEPLSEEELARRSAENMRRVYQEERRRKYLQELHDIDSRRHTDNFIPSQKSPIPLNRYDDYIDSLSQRSRSQEQTPEPRLVARALYNFVGQSPRELTFRRGDIIFVRRQVDKNWYEGEHNANIGLFPFNYVEIVPYDGVTRTTPKKPYEGQARAKFNFIAQTNLELSLAKGELVVLTRRVDENWYEGRVANRKGIFPVSYVEVLAEPGLRPETPVQNKPVAAPAAHSLLSNGTSGGKMSMGSHHYTPSMPVSFNTTQHHYNSLPRMGGNKLYVAPVNETLHIDTHSEPVPYRALYNYRPQNEDELELKEGDTVFVMEKCDDGWYVGSSQRTGYFGTFPGNYVERL